MKIVHLLKRERRRLQAFRLVTALCLSLTLVGLLIIAFFCLNRLLHFFPLVSGLAFEVFGLGVVAAVFLGMGHFWRTRRSWTQVSLAEVGELIERQSPYLKARPSERSELRSAGAFAEGARPRESEEFVYAHLKSLDSKVLDWNWRLRPSVSMAVAALGVAFVAVVLGQFPDPREVWVPRTGFVWAPSSHEVLLPYPEAQWERRTSTISSLKGSKIRIETPASLFQVYIFTQMGAGWSAYPCSQFCEWTLTGSGQFALGTLLSRSSTFPMQAFTDEPPKSAVFVKVAGESVPGATLQVLNQKTLQLELVASDDLRLTGAKLIHKFGETQKVIHEISTKEKNLKAPYELKMEGWKGGQHLIFLEPRDDFQSSRSEPLQILYNDENTLREKRLRDLEALVNEWVHVLADLLESRADKKFNTEIENRVRSIQYPPQDQEGLIAAYMKELQLLGDRILRWTEMRGPMSRIDDLIGRVERSILYGLSLIFQERAGDISQTSQDLKSSQADLAKLLDQIKQGKLDLDSEALEQAFKELAQKLEELQKKISELPQGPNDDMVNREALESQAAEAESLAERIEAIRNQARSGDSKGALRELESLLNQLSILSREMERGLEQWEQNLDEGALQKSEEFAKKIDEIRKKQEELQKKTEAAQEKLKKMEEDSSAIFASKDLKEQEQLEKSIEGLQKQQGELSQELSRATEEFDRSLQGTEWSQLFRSEEMKALESEAQERMMKSEEGLESLRMTESVTQQKEAVAILKKISEGQKQMQNQVQQMMGSHQALQEKQEKMEILGSEGKGERERKRKIMDSLKQNVGEKYQKSHERYFEELLQR